MFLARLTFALFAVGMMATFAAAQQEPPQWNSTGTFIGGGLVRGSDGNYYRALHNSTGADPTKDDHTNWELYYSRASITLPIAMSDSRFTSLKQAWGFVSSAQIPATATVTLSISSAKAPYLESFSGQYSLNHGCGEQVQIVGDNPSSITLKFPTGSYGFAITNHHALGGINNVTIDGTSPGSDSVGFLVTQQSRLGASAISIRNFVTGFSLTEMSSADLTGSSITSFSGTAIVAFRHCFLTATSCTVDGGSLGSTGIYAADGSTAEVSQTSVSNTLSDGFVVISGSTMSAENAIAHKTGNGFLASVRATLTAANATSSNNKTGFFSAYGSYILCTGAILKSNSTDFLPAANTAQPDGTFISH